MITEIEAGIRARHKDQAVNGVFPRNALTVTATAVAADQDIAFSSNGYTITGDGIVAENQYGGDFTISVASVTGHSHGNNTTAIATQVRYQPLRRVR